MSNIFNFERPFIMQTPLFKNLIISGFLLLLFVVGMNLISVGQSCRVYEKELESYFMEYRPGDKIDLPYLERTRWKCDYPTHKLDLIYYFFQSLNTLGNSEYPDQQTYENAKRFFDESVSHLSYLTNENSSFIDLFADRAEIQEAKLNMIADRMNYYPQYVHYRNDGSSGNESWVKRGMDDPNSNASNQRISSPSNTEFVKKFYHKGRYQPPRTNSVYSGVTTGANGEFYGFVGDLSDLNPAAYFRWLRTQPEYMEERTRRLENVAANEQSRLDEPTRGSEPAYGKDWVNDYLNDKAFMPMVSVYDNLSIQTKPGKVAEEIDVLKFGEVVARSKDESPVFKDGVAYIQVRNKDGNVGWVKQSSVIDEGQLAVFTDQNGGYQNLTNRTDANRMSFKKGELVVLEAVKGDWIRVVTQNEGKRGWVYGIENLSIDPHDIQIAHLIDNAYKDVSSYGRLIKLQNIKVIPGFETSIFAPFVLEKIKETEQRGGFSFN